MAISDLRNPTSKEMQFDLSNEVVVQSEGQNGQVPRRSLDLANIRTPELRLLTPRRSEIAPKGIARGTALIAYSDRLRSSYRNNEGGLRDGMLLLGRTFHKGQSIAVSCFCRAGEMCHADVVKMAIEKVSSQIKIRENVEHKTHGGLEEHTNMVRSNPRTERAIIEILGVGQSEVLLSKLDNTDGRSRSEHASYINEHSQFARDLYERGAVVRDGVLISPKELPSLSRQLTITTHEHTVQKLERILGDEARAKELAPKIIEYGSKIAGVSADSETRMKVSTWMLEALEGRNDFLATSDKTVRDETQQERFERTLGEIRDLAEEMSRLEPSDKFVPLNDHDESVERNKEEFSPEAVYGNAIGIENDPFQSNLEGHSTAVQEFDRFYVGHTALSRMVANMSKRDLERWTEVRLPALDRELESGKPVNEILKKFKDIVYQTSKNDPANKQDAINDLKFASAYIEHQLKQPESRLRHFNARYRDYADALESAATRNEVIDAASRIRRDNARVGFEWDKMSHIEKEQVPRPLTSREMQILFTELSPRHYTGDMIVTKLSYAQSGEGREMTTAALMKGEIEPSPEAQRLLDSLEARLERRYLKDSLAATKHYLRSLKTPNTELRYKNEFDHREAYLKLPPSEKDFIYQRSVQQKEALETKLQTQDENVRTEGIPSSSPEPQKKFNEFRENLKLELINVLKENPGITRVELLQQTSETVKSSLNRADVSLPIHEKALFELSNQLEERLNIHRSITNTRDFAEISLDKAKNHPVKDRSVSYPERLH